MGPAVHGPIGPLRPCRTAGVIRHSSRFLAQFRLSPARARRRRAALGHRRFPARVPDAPEPRAGELFFREQKASTEDGAVMLADLETVEMHASGGSLGSLGRLIVESQAPLATVNLEVLDTENAQAYWLRDQRHDFVISMNFGRAANEAFCRVMEKWVRHFFGVAVSIKPLRSVEDHSWAWHIGLDAESTALLNGLWRGDEVEPGNLRRLLALFRPGFEDPAPVRPDLAGKPVYLALSMDENGVVRMKPQNLLLNLPLASPA